jgi:pyruvyltransferase
MLSLDPNEVKLVDQRHKDTRKLLAVGSVLVYARKGDVVWGTGCHDKSIASINWPDIKNTTMLAIRGPLSCAKVLEMSGKTSCGTAQGDPGLLGDAIPKHLTSQRRLSGRKYAKSGSPHIASA